MAVANQIQKKANTQGTFSGYLNSTAIQTMLEQTFQDENKRNKFTQGIVTMVSNNPALRECDYNTIISASMQGESLNLSFNTALGHQYVIPFKDNRNDRIVATWQLGWKGYVQLAIRSGQYKKLNVIEIKEGELKHYDALNEEIECVIIEDAELREKAKTIGYYAMFELTNGFRKSIYWSVKKMETHAMTYSMGYKAKKGYTFWEKDFDGMAKKTMIRQLLSKWGIMSIELESAIESDYSYKDNSGKRIYTDVDGEYVQAEFNDEVVVSTPKKPINYDDFIDENNKLDKSKSLLE